jgi:hypothetical protein
MKLRANTSTGHTVELSISPEMIERVLAEWEAENPGRDATRDMGEDEFARRVMAEVRAGARLVPPLGQ